MKSTSNSRKQNARTLDTREQYCAVWVVGCDIDRVVYRNSFAQVSGRLQVSGTRFFSVLLSVMGTRPKC